MRIRGAALRRAEDRLEHIALRAREIDVREDIQHDQHDQQESRIEAEARADEAAQQEPAAAVEERRKESDDIAQLRAQMAQMQEQLAALAAKK